MTFKNTKGQGVPYLIVAFCIILSALVYAAWSGLIEMERMWSTKEEYGYAYMIPFISAYFIWQQRYVFLQEKFNISKLGIASYIFSLFILLLGVLSATFSIMQYGFLFSIISAVWMLIGWRAFRKIIVPLLMLLLVVPLPAFLFNNLSSQLQLISSQLGVLVIRALGVSVFLDGNVIDLGAFKLQVVEACSGLRYLFPLFSLALITAYIYRAATWKRIVIMLSSIPITVLMNSFRIGVIGVLVEYGGIEQAKGFLHEFEGWFVFMACIALLIIEMWVLLKIGPEKLSLAQAFVINHPEKPTQPVEINKASFGARYIVVAVITSILAVTVGSINNKNEIIPKRESFDSFPLVVGSWTGTRGIIQANYLDALKLTDYMIADYSNTRGDAVNFYMAYYASQSSGAAAHSPRTCIPGGGWRIKEHDVIQIKQVKHDGHPLSVNRMRIQKGDDGQLVYYWFQQRGRDITNEYLVKWYLFWDSLTMHRTDGALVRLTTRVSQGEDRHLADQRLVSLLKQVNPLLDAYIPK